jgi:hypothetical protein
MRLTAILILILAFLFPGSLYAESQDSRPLKRFEKLVGIWENISGNTTYLETWEWSSHEILKGSASLKNGQGKILFSEILQIQQIGVHTVYIACVNNHPPVLFTLTDEKETDSNTVQWTFENPEHDFPQRIVYRLEAGDTLYAWVEGTENGKFNKEEFHLKRKSND